MAEPRTTPARRAAGAAVLVFAVTASLFLSAPASQAAEYPSWEQVQSARASEASTQTQITELTGLLQSLEADVATAQREQQQRGEAYERAQGAYDRANHRAATLQEQADAASARADTSQVQAGRLAASLSRTAGSNLTLSLLTGKDSSSLLNQLATMSKLAEKTDTIYATATADANTAQALTEQADIVTAELGELASASQNALADAIAASDAVQQRRDEQAVNAATLQAQLSVLTEDRAATEADYQRGEDARRAAEAAAAAQASQAAAARTAQAAATAVRTAPAPVSGGRAPAAGGAAPVPSGSGWVRPVSGWISSAFGPRPNRPVAGVGSFHYGTDLAAGCGVPISAASAGTVAYSGPLGSYGNWVLLDHGNGIQTGYAHNSTNLVSVGQSVTAGQSIALVGSTGASSGCHLHYETRVNGARVDPEPFMSARGVTLG
ncbi:peptidoglycan DD-metalloendopeptidase family protein [Rathayibacter sp. ZW T2_19]|uniref:Peptidoglycan DD-metalloendopeptidase family protein n=1 Tax=Rathayibacter rubneri TaxID=2950106 RepID=A0A9X2DUX0_9MICO|nr:M23 family metallopeptidase [Rathayibacter rubneri]MCM6761182.1 peptidoglycan DD-metalloendopeptidase family protein [Rathayibacter rubneri]